MEREPSYLRLFRTGELQRRARALDQRARNCDLCPHRCRVDRTAEEVGFCRTPAEPVVSSYTPHFGEEPPLVGNRGSGTIFFTNCNLRCAYCQNCDISQFGAGSRVSVQRLAEMMLELQDAGCHNVNVVSPSHQVHAIVAALAVAADHGLRIPLVYNTGGYDAVETLRELHGIVDIYMPDVKYADDETGRLLSAVPDYATIVRRAVTEMHAQVGDLRMDERGIAYQGLLVRHLVLPNGLAGSESVMQFLAGLSRDTYVNVMDQYRPLHLAREHPELRRRVLPHEYREAVRAARNAGLRRAQ